MKLVRNILGLLFIFSSLVIQAGEAEDVFEKATVLYNAERYDEAASLYQQLIDSDFEQADLYYNLGNAYYKAKKIPYAIYYYEKAKKLSPGDEDILHNLKIANQQIVDKLELVPEPFFELWWNTWLRFFSPNQWSIIALVLFNLIFLLASLFFLSRSVRWKKISFYSGLITLVLTVFAFFFAYQSYHSAMQHEEAIIFTPSVVVKSSPNEKSVDLFVIHEGLKVKLIQKEKDWTKIRIGNGKIGWVLKEEYREI